MGDKNPKHPLKKKKVAAKVNATHNAASDTDDIVSSKSKKKHTYQ